MQPGGCSGLIYQLYFDERLLDGDATVDFDGVEVVVDKMSVPYLDGATIDFEDTIQKQGFTIDNPNAAGQLRLRRHVPLSRGVPTSASQPGPPLTGMARFLPAFRRVPAG